MKKKILALVLCFTMVFTMTGYVGFGDYSFAYAAQENVHNVTQNKWYSTLSAATAAATANNIIEVHNSFTETKSVEIKVDNLTIRAADGCNPIISWTSVDEIRVSYATPYHCVVIYTSVTKNTTFGGGTGTLTFDASKASDEDNKGKRARVMAHCGKGNLYLNDGIVLTGGNTGGGSYISDKVSNGYPVGSGEIEGENGFGSGLFMRYGTLIMNGGIIKDNCSLWGTSPTHNYVGGGGGVYLYGKADGSEYTTMVMNGGTITHNAAGSGGGGGILVGFSSKLTVEGGTISENVCRFASGGGIGVRTKSEVKIKGGLIKENYVSGHGGGLFARGDSIPLEITGGTFEGNVAGSLGGGVLFWTVGDDVSKNTVKIGGDAKIINNKATDGAGISVGREVLEGKPIGNKAKLVITGSSIISGNIASNNGGGIQMQSDEFSAAVNTVEILGGTFSNNEAQNGAGIYVPGGTVTVTGGSFTENTAMDRGAGIFTGGGTMTISNATFSENEAANFGGGAYVVNGTVNLESGTLYKNSATNGGAIYVTGGNVNMADGIVDNNTSIGNGGAIYVTKGNFTMTSGKLTNNKSGNDSTLSNGGGVYVEGGNITIGVQGCNGGAEGTNHTHSITNKAHPIVKGNTATDSGGGIALIGNGNIDMFCANIIDNYATNRGRGLNIYMELGQFNYYNGDIGSLENPELVIVGGTLNHANSTSDKLMLEYYHCNDQAKFETPHEGDFDEKIAFATIGTYYNLPDGEKYWSAPENHRFFGWTFYGPNDKDAPTFVRSKLDYKGLGEPIEVIDTEDENHDEVADGKITMYALWAPEESDIKYEAVTFVNGEYIPIENATELEKMNAHNPEKYYFSVASNIDWVDEPTKAGYTFTGWYVYQELEQNANWGYEPAYKNGKLDYDNLKFYSVDDETEKLDFGNTHFGDVTLIAKFEPAFADLSITKDGWDSKDANQTFLFQVTGTPDDSELAPVDMVVTIQGNGSVILKDLPVGKYEVKEVTEWSWRYSVVGLLINEVTLDNPEEVEEVKITNSRNNNFWLSGDSFVDNLWSNANRLIPREKLN